MNRLLSESGYEVLRAAVNIAREHRCATVVRLKAHLLAVFPGRQEDIDEAINYWAADVRRRHPNGVSGHYQTQGNPT
jgi:hypothetical protein